MMRVWINIFILIACAYGAYGILEHANRQFTSAHWQYYSYAISPWLLLFGSLKAWHRSFIWRRMVGQRQGSPVLSRGNHRIEKTIQRPSILEYASVSMLLLALAAILIQFSVEHVQWWIGSLVSTWIVLRFVLKRLA